MKCSKCNKEAEFDSPQLFCAEHWAEWWSQDLPDDENKLTPEEKETLYKEALEVAMQNKRG